LNGRQQKSDQKAGRRDHHNQFDQRETGDSAVGFVICFHIHSSLFILIYVNFDGALRAIRRTLDAGLISAVDR
jgi:hypothetical protein